MANNKREPEENEEVFIDAEYNPLSEPINEKPYTKPNVTIDPKDLQGEIPEPDFTPPPMGSSEFEDEPPINKKEKTQQAPRPERKPPPPPLNPEMEGAKRSQNKKSAKMLAEMSMQGYELLHKVANMSLPISQKQINKMVEKGVDLNMELDYDGRGNTMSVKDFIEEYNDQNKELLSVDEEFKEEVIPVLTEVYEKRGLGATPEQKLAFLVAKDVGVKVMIVSSALSMQKAMINNWIASSQQNQFQAPSGTPPPPPRPQPKQDFSADTEAIVVEDYDPLNEDLSVVEMEEIDPMSVNYQVEKMTNPDGESSRRRGRPNKK